MIHLGVFRPYTGYLILSELSETCGEFRIETQSWPNRKDDIAAEVCDPGDWGASACCERLVDPTVGHVGFQGHTSIADTGHCGHYLKFTAAGS